jgi:flavin-dependent dehydrogenase
MAACDILVIGGGPAGSTVATLLAKKGYDVILVEKDEHPRFHIGESLLPQNLRLFEALGIADHIRALGVHKKGAQFIAGQHGNSHTFYFSEAMDNHYNHAYQVKRADFDKLLFDNAAMSGVRTLENTRVTRVIFNDTKKESIRQVIAEGKDGQTYEFEPSFVVDATGRDTLLANTLKTKKRNPHNNSAAIFGHFRNVTRFPGDEEGNIRIYLADRGWMWMIPLHDGITSVGIVATPEYLKSRRTPLADFMREHCRRNLSVWKRMEAAEPVGDIQATGNFSYNVDKMYGQNYMMIGDAFAFIDPIFSTGVLIAMNGAFGAAYAIDTAMNEPKKQRKLFDSLYKNLKQDMKRISWFIYRINCPVFRDMIVHPRNILRMENAIISMFAGDFKRNTRFSLPLMMFKGIYRVKRLFYI